MPLVSYPPRSLLSSVPIFFLSFNLLPASSPSFGPFHPLSLVPILFFLSFSFSTLALPLPLFTLSRFRSSSRACSIFHALSLSQPFPIQFVFSTRFSLVTRVSPSVAALSFPEHRPRVFSQLERRFLAGVSPFFLFFFSSRLVRADN